jgi:UDP-glucose 4-epimerase
VGEAMARAFHHSYGLNPAALRYMNVYGPRLDDRAYIAVITRMLDAINDGPTIFGDRSDVFDFVAVQNCGRANLFARRTGMAVDRLYDVGTGKRASLKELAEVLLGVTGSNMPIKYAPRDQVTLVRNRIGSPRRAAELGFAPETALEEGLRRVTDWCRTDRGCNARGGVQ